MIFKIVLWSRMDCCPTLVNLKIWALTCATIAVSFCRIKIQYKVTVTDVEFKSQQIAFTSPDSSEPLKLNYDILIGADGRNSIIRQKLAEFEPNVKYELTATPDGWKSFTGLPTIGEYAYPNIYIIELLDKFNCATLHCWRCKSYEKIDQDICTLRVL